MNENPRHGGRVRFDLQESTPTSATYRVTLFAQEATHDGVARLCAETGEVSLLPGESEPPAWLIKAALPFAKQLLNGHRADPEAAWPRRVLRWRGQK